MTITETCDVIVELTSELSQARRERAAYRFVAVQALHALHDLQKRNRQRERQYLALLVDDMRQLRYVSRRAA